MPCKNPHTLQQAFYNLPKGKEWPCHNRIRRSCKNQHRQAFKAHKGKLQPHQTRPPKAQPPAAPDRGNRPKEQERIHKGKTGATVLVL